MSCPERERKGNVSETLSNVLQNAVKQAIAPGAVAYLGTPNKTLFHEAAGFRQLVPKRLPAEKNTLYDLASLTKVIATTTAIMILRDQGLLDLDQPVSEFVPIPEFRAFTIRHLLTHTAGLPAVKPFYREVSSLNEMLQRIAATPLNWPPGARRRYSDLGFMILGKVIELVAGDSLDAFCQKNIFAPAGMSRTAFNPPPEWRNDCAATELCAWRNRIILGEVHDENAYAMGGVAGHAGLFAPAKDIASFCRALLDGKLLAEKTLAEMTCLNQFPPYPWQGLGWQMDPWISGVSGFLPARSAFGHTGWTGTCLWADRDSGLFCILLSNTCHPSREQRNNATLRRIFFSAVAATHYRKTWNVHTGLDRVLEEDFAPLRGKRLAVLTNHAAVDQSGRQLLDALALDSEIILKRIYSPEHGLRGQAEAGEQVRAEDGPVPVTSLYGRRKQPTAEELEDIELFVVDLPDIGSRYYTYMATMKDCMAACAEHRVPMLILDRPNPIGGVILEGPIARVTDSPVCCAPIPIRHGMTLGELALFFQKTEFAGSRLQLSVSLAGNWLRERMFDACSLPWIPPSPNIPTPEIALIYSGTCLFEGVNLNEGRGTEKPFQIIGAPWLDPDGVLETLDPREYGGCTLKSVTYTPRSLPGKVTHPVYEDESCQGIRIRITNADIARPVTLSIALLSAIHRRHQNDLNWKKHFDVLAGGPTLRRQIVNGVPALELTQTWKRELDAFDRDRPKRYPTRDQFLAGTGLQSAIGVSAS